MKSCSSSFLADAGKRIRVGAAWLRGRRHICPCCCIINLCFALCLQILRLPPARSLLTPRSHPAEREPLCYNKTHLPASPRRRCTSSISCAALLQSEMKLNDPDLLLTRGRQVTAKQTIQMSSPGGSLTHFLPARGTYTNNFLHH